MLNSIFLPTQLPDQSLSEDEMIAQFGSIKNFYKATAQHLSTYYNRQSPSEFDKVSNGVGSGEVQQIIDNLTYFHGIQKNTEFAYLSETLDEVGKRTDMATPYMAGQDIGSILLFMQGQFMGIVSSAEPRIDVINPESKNELTQKVKMVQAMKVFKDIIAKITETTGMDMVSPADPNADIGELIKTLQLSTNSEFVKYANIVLEYVKRNGMAVQDYARSLINVLAGRRAIIYVDNDGILHNIEPYNYAKVSYRDDDFGKYDYARGMVQRMHRDDFLARYSDELSQSEIEEVRSGAFLSYSGFAVFDSMYNYNLFDTATNEMSLITWYWKSTLDTGYDVRTEEDGTKVVYKVRKNKSGKKGKPVQVIRKATIGANWVVVDYGIHDVLEDPNQIGNKLFPISVFEPNVFLGINRSLVDRLKGKQKELDAINQRVRENYTMDLGTVLSFNGKKFKNGLTPELMYEQLRRTRITVSTTSGLEDDITNNEPLMQREDVSLMRDIQNYLSIKQAMQQDIKEIANVSAMTMGRQDTYVGLRTQQNSQALAANSVQYYYMGVMQVFADAAAMGVEYVRKDIYKNPTKQKWLSLLGEKGVEMMNLISKQPLWKLQAYISTRDIIDPVRKQRMLGMLDNLAATGQIDVMDWLNVEDAKTITELKSSFAYSLNKKAEMQRIQAMIAQATNVQRTDIMAEGQMQSKMIEQRGMNQRNAADNITKMASQMLKEGRSQEEVNAFLAGAANEQGAPQGQPMQQEQPMQQGQPMM
jgi:hypothetical protein